MDSETISLNDLLTRAGITKAELARRLSISTNAITAWKNQPPGYAIAYLKLLIEYNRICP